MFVARLGDATSHGGAITVGIPTIRIYGQPIAVAGISIATCSLLHGASPLASGSASVLAYGAPVSRLGDCTGCGAQVISGAANVLIWN